MTFALYLLVAGQAFALTTLAVRDDRGSAQVRDFAVLGLLAALTYAAFGVYLLTGSIGVRVLYAAAGALLPSANLRFLDHFFPGPTGQPRGDSRLVAASLAVAGGYLVWAALSGGPDPGPGTAEKVLGTLVFLGFGVNLWRMWQRHRDARSPHVRDRILYLGLFMGGALFFSGLEGLLRVAADAPPTGAGWLASSAARQGTFPPVGVMLSGLYILFLHQVLRAQRLLDLKEIVTRIVTVAMSAGVFTAVLVPTALLRIGGHAGPTPAAQAIWMAFVTAVLFLIGYEALRSRLEAWLVPVLNRRGTQLAAALAELEAWLPSSTTEGGALGRVVDELFGAGLPMVAFYQYNRDAQQFTLRQIRKGDRPDPLPIVAPHPFVLGFEAGDSTYHLPDLRRRALHAPDPEPGLRAQLLEGMDADLVVPLRTASGVAGWLALRDADSSDGFSREEQQRLVRLMGRVATQLEHLKGFEASREQARLAALGTMSAGLAHEIRNPLAGLKGAAQVLLRLSPSDDQREFIQVITDETDRLNKVVTSFLDYARPMVLHREPTELRALVGQVLQLVRAQGLPAGVLLEELGDPAPVQASVDGDKLRQVVLNLVQNAVYAVSDGGVVRVFVGARAPTRPGVLGRVEVRVEDTGPGLAPEVRESLFIPFVTTKVQGTGLGLAVCQRIVKAHEGEIRVESTPGQGARFVVSLPESADTALRPLADSP